MPGRIYASRHGIISPGIKPSQRLFRFYQSPSKFSPEMYHEFLRIPVIKFVTIHAPFFRQWILVNRALLIVFNILHVNTHFTPSLIPRRNQTIREVTVNLIVWNVPVEWRIFFPTWLILDEDIDMNAIIDSTFNKLPPFIHLNNHLSPFYLRSDLMISMLKRNWNGAGHSIHIYHEIQWSNIHRYCYVLIIRVNICILIQYCKIFYGVPSTGSK